MACGWKCPMSYQNEKEYGFLICRFLMKDNIDYDKRENAMNVLCAYQYKCSKTGKQENTETAKKCYEYQSGKI